ncbi:hypothetical protein MMC07_000932 [Pseudocyphellaria aurata]|nr:hypothetical protein [Pseudocyphellaria aurata]
MMVRKQVKAVNENLSTGLPYPVTPVAANGSNSEGAAFVSRNGNTPASTGVAHNNPIDVQNSNAIWADMVDSKATNPLPSTLRVAEEKGGRTTNTGAAIKEGGLPPSLQIGTVVMTPRSSFDSQRSMDSASYSRHDLQASYQQTLPSNNPWAGASGSPSRDSNTPAIKKLPESIGTSQPFAEPWFDFESSPVQHGPPVPGTTADPLSNQEESPPGPVNFFGNNRGPPDVEKRRDIGPDILAALLYQGSELQELDGISPWGSGNEPNVIPNSLPQSAESAPGLPPRQIPPEKPPRPKLDIPLSPSDMLRMEMEQEIPPVKPPRPLLENPLSSSDTLHMGVGGESFLSPQGSSRTEHDVVNPLVSGNKTSLTLDTETQNKLAAQRSETYQIRLVNWSDATLSGDIRSSPIMVQNANGPCPLLALVNALTLSTPADNNTVLVETLRVREQVSLGLLLDAVIDELMSGRRGDAAHNLPDVSDLYAFLVNLHTGMNVNPSFIPSDAGVINLMDAPIAELPINPTAFGKPGGFENTREMKLYSTFGVPLIHGWIPPRNHPAFAALNRSAKTYEEAQNLMFREEELEEKLQRQGLNNDEQLMLEDVSNVKYFLSSSATQLTAHGLETMADALGPGAIAILFRNDHFSTLYKHPHSGQLFTLVTDMGYARHDEVVWESLVDVNGEGCEFFAGDFRPVGHHTTSSSNTTHPSPNSGRTTAARSNGNNNNTLHKAQPSHDLSSANVSQPFSLLSIKDDAPQSPSAEQEDHDLALALQLQEEEEDLHRRETAARRLEENKLSQAYLASETSSPSNRRGAGRGRRQGQELRPLVPPRGGAAPTPRKSHPDDGEDTPPPTYEQAAHGPAYHPPLDHPQNPHTPSNLNSSATRLHANTSRQSAYSQNSVAFGGSPSAHGIPTLAPSPIAGRGSRRRSNVPGRTGTGREGAGMTGQDDDDKRDCVVM